MDDNRTAVYVSSSCQAGSSAIGGWAVYIRQGGCGCPRIYSGCASDTSSMRMELTAVIRALEWALEYVRPITVHTTNPTVLKLASGEYSPKRNFELIQKLWMLFGEVDAEFELIEKLDNMAVLREARSQRRMQIRDSQVVAQQGG